MKVEQVREFREAASMDQKFGKNGRDRIVCFSPGPENQCARRTRNREINHCALSQSSILDLESSGSHNRVRGQSNNQDFSICVDR